MSSWRCYYRNNIKRRDECSEDLLSIRTCKICRFEMCENHIDTHEHYYQSTTMTCEKCNRPAVQNRRCNYHGYRGVTPFYDGR